MAWRTRDGQSSEDRPYRRGTEPAKGYLVRPDERPGKRLVRETESHLRWESKTEAERSEFSRWVLWGDD